MCWQESAQEPYAWARNWRIKRSAEAAIQTENGEKPRSSLTRTQTKFSSLAQLKYCGKNANYRVMRMTECPEGRLLTDTSEPCGHRLSGDEAGFGALASEGRCVTGIKRAGTANEIQFSPAKSNDIFYRGVRYRAREPYNGLGFLAVDSVTDCSGQKFHLLPAWHAQSVSTADTSPSSMPPIARISSAS